MPAVRSRIATPMITSDPFRCIRPRSLQRRRIVTTPFPLQTRLLAPSCSFTMRPPPRTHCPVPPSVRLCDVSSPIAILYCTLQSPLLCCLTPRSSQCQRTLSTGKSGSHVPLFARTQSALCRRPIPCLRLPVTSHTPARHIAHACSVSSAGTRGPTWTLSPSTRISHSGGSCIVMVRALRCCQQCFSRCNAFFAAAEMLDRQHHICALPGVQ
jgi:hypothetical protein